MSKIMNVAGVVRELSTRAGDVVVGGALVVVLAAMGVFGPLAPVTASESVPAAPAAPAVTAVQVEPQRPTLNVEGMPRDVVVELLTTMDFTGNAPVLADVTVVTGPDQVDVATFDNWEIGVLMGMGYRGDPNDGVERLYAPGF